MNEDDILPNLFQAAFVVAFVVCLYRLLVRSAWGWMELPPTKFWQVVGRAEQPLVLITVRGFFWRCPCYVYPYHGLVFFTWSRPDDLPKGVTLISAEDATLWRV